MTDDQQPAVEAATGDNVMGKVLGTFDGLVDNATAAVGGDLGWIQLAQLKNAQLEAVAAEMAPGQLVGPVRIPGGFSILYLIDKRQILTADPRDAQLSLKQISIKFPANASQAAAQPILDRFAQETQDIRGCGNADDIAATLNADVVNRDGVRLGDLPGPLQEVMAKLEELAATCDKDVLARLQALVALNERMVSQKSEFKKACAKQLGEMNAELEARSPRQVSSADRRAEVAVRQKQVLHYLRPQ